MRQIVGSLLGSGIKQASASGVDWSAYDGTNNGTPTDIMPWSSGHVHTSAVISDTAAVLVGRNADAAPTDFTTGLITIDGTSLSVGAAVSSLTTAAQANSEGSVALSATRVLAFTASGTGVMELRLLDQTATLLDSYDTAASFIEVIADYGYLTSHSATLAVATYRDYTSNDYYMVAIDVTGDTITVGTPVQIDTATCVAKSGCAALTATLGHVNANGRIYRYTISGTTITIGNSVSVGTETAVGSSDLVRIDDTHSLFIVTSATLTGGATWGIYGLVIADATTPTIATAATQLSDDVLVNNPDLQAGRCAVPVRETDGSVDQVLVAVPETDGNIITLVVSVDTATYALSDTGEVAVAGAYNNATQSRFCLSQFGYNGKALATYHHNSDNLLYGVVISA